MTYCWTESGLDSCQKVDTVIAHLPAGESKALLPSLLTWDPTKRICSSSLESMLTARRCRQRLVPRGQGSLHWMMSYEVENIPQVLCLGREGEWLQSVKLGLMMASWCGVVVVWRWKMQVVQISLQELSEILWFWKDKKVCDSNKMPRINQSCQRVTALNWTQNGKHQILQCLLSPCVQTLYNTRVKYVTT